MMLRILFCALIAMPAQASEWGRFFYSEQERREGIIKPVDNGEATQKSSSSQRFDGELHTPRGKVHWVNGERAPPPAGKKPGDIWYE
nr:hypothetical protein [uncultured Deefgea sp.]